MSLKPEGITDSKQYQSEKDMGISHGSLNNPDKERKNNERARERDQKLGFEISKSEWVKIMVMKKRKHWQWQRCTFCVFTN